MRLINPAAGRDHGDPQAARQTTFTEPFKDNSARPHHRSRRPFGTTAQHRSPTRNWRGLLLRAYRFVGAIYLVLSCFSCRKIQARISSATSRAKRRLVCRTPLSNPRAPSRAKRPGKGNQIRGRNKFSCRDRNPSPTHVVFFSRRRLSSVANRKSGAFLGH